MITYGKILQELDDVLTKKAFIPAPNSQVAQQAQQEQMAQQQAQQQQQAPEQAPQQDQQAPEQQAQQQQVSDMSPKEMPNSLKDTMVTLSVADLLDLHSGGKATQSHLKTESMKVKHQFEHEKMLREQQRKQEEEDAKRQQEEAMAQQQQQGMMGGGIYAGGPMDGSNPTMQ